MSATIGCAPPVDLSASLHVEDVATGWFDEGVVDGRTKVVPAVSLKLKNESAQTLSTEASGRFVNGVLGAVARAVAADGEP